MKGSYGKRSRKVGASEEFKLYSVGKKEPLKVFK